MRILIISNEVWNDKINGNNVISNWFEGMNAEFANIYCSPGAPYNKCCKRYYQITDTMMFKSVVGKKKAGREVLYTKQTNGEYVDNSEKEPKKLYNFLKSISNSLLRLVRELLWLIGRYDVATMQSFISEFHPDVIFSERMASCKMLRLEKIIHSISNAPFLAFTGDDEYSLKQIQFSPFFWINRFMVRKRLRNNVKFYRIYYTLSLEQAKLYEKKFGCKCKILQKCGTFSNDFSEKIIGTPIKLIYAGKLYCNRWKALADISKAISIINKEKQTIVLHIYTKDTPSKKQTKLLDDKINSEIFEAVSQEKLKDKYHESDIALHVESCDIKNRLATKYSFSTKIIDCLFSGCAVLAYCWDQHSGLTTLKREDAAMCVSSFEELLIALKEISNNPTLLYSYQKKAYNSAIKYHNTKNIQTMLLNDFTRESSL